jgi:hypothetical protein
VPECQTWLFKGYYACLFKKRVMPSRRFLVLYFEIPYARHYVTYCFVALKCCTLKFGLFRREKNLIGEKLYEIAERVLGSPGGEFQDWRGYVGL